MRLLQFFIATIVCLYFSDAKCFKVHHNVSDEDYYSIPPVFSLDDFDSCIYGTKPTLYCYATIQLAENKKSRTWQIIEQLNSVNRTYRHDQLRYGICVPKRCDNIKIESYITGNGSTELWKGLSECYSKKFSTLGLKSQLLSLHCENDKPFYQVDSLDRAFGVFVTVIVLLVVLSTLCSIYFEYYKPEIFQNLDKTQGGKAILGFSLNKNFEKLCCENTSKDSITFFSFQGIRVYNSFLVVMCHTVMVNLLLPVINTKHVEELSLKSRYMIISNANGNLETFLITSAWFLSYYLLREFENKKMTLKHALAIFFTRYVRLTPLLLLVVGFHSTWLRHLSRGPVWHHVINKQFNNCRKNWALNLLMINNYYKPNELCIDQTWYSSADSQMFALGLVIMFFVVKYPKHTPMIMISLITTGILITFLQHYYYEYDIIFRSYPEVFYNIYINLEEWLVMYIPGHHHFPCYVQGLLCGYYYYKFEKEGKVFRVNQVAWWLFVWVLPLWTIYYPSIYYQEGVEYSRFGAALYQSTARYLFGMPISVAMFGLLFGMGGLMRPILTWPPLRVLARVSYCVYLIHPTLMRWRYGITRSPIYIDDYYLTGNVLADIFMSYLVGFVVVLFFEMPFAALQKIAFSPRTTTMPKDGKKSE